MGVLLGPDALFQIQRLVTAHGGSGCGLSSWISAAWCRGPGWSSGFLAWAWPIHCYLHHSWSEPVGLNLFLFSCDSFKWINISLKRKRSPIPVVCVEEPLTNKRHGSVCSSQLCSLKYETFFTKFYIWTARSWHRGAAGEAPGCDTGLSNNSSLISSSGSDAAPC